MNRSEEDYLKIIYELTKESDKEMTRISDISSILGFTDQSVNEMIKKLVQKEKVEFIPYKGVKLTHNGEIEALAMIRKHRIWEVFLTEKLNISWENVHENAEKLEHVTSDEVIKKLYEYLGKPTHCQHGGPIPDFEGHIIDVSKESLMDYQVKDNLKIVRLIDKKELLDYLIENNINLYDEIIIKNKNDFSELLTIETHKVDKILPYKLARMIFAEKVS